MSLRILVVDDHDVVRQGVRLILRSRSDWQVCGEASNGLEALDKAAELEPDLIILDISMPGKDGLSVASELQARGDRAMILILTMHDSKELAAAVKNVGARGYVTKSHAARDLVAAIQTVVDGQGFFLSDTGPTKSGNNPAPSTA
jgi:DNA-binding NarL/FixJ family response regulator